MMVMFGAFIVYNNNGKLQAEIFPKSIDIWPVNGVSHVTSKEDKEKINCQANDDEQEANGEPQLRRSARNSKGTQGSDSRADKNPDDGKTRK
jgi:hypothetical protein